MRISLTFLILAAGCLAVGVCLGMYMGIVHDFGLAPVHAHVNLLGWASCAIFGLTYAAFPEMEQTRLARVHLLLSGTSGVLFPAAIYLSIAHNQPQLAMLAAPMWLAGVLTFLAGLIRMARRSAPGAPQGQAALVVR